MAIVIFLLCGVLTYYKFNKNRITNFRPILVIIAFPWDDQRKCFCNKILIERKQKGNGTIP